MAIFVFVLFQEAEGIRPQMEDWEDGDSGGQESVGRGLRDDRKRRTFRRIFGNG